MITTYDCPNCGGSIDVRGVDDAIRCRYCGSQIALPRRPTSRKELELERDQLLARASDWETRVKQAKAWSPQDVIVPPAGCCGLYFGFFVIGSLILSAVGAQAAKQYGTAVAAIAIVAGLVGLVMIIRWREIRRRELLLALERERALDRERCEQRMREIDAELACGD